MVKLRASLLTTLSIAALFLEITAHDQENKFAIPETNCRLIESKFSESNPWVSYPVIFEPINRGKLTLWTASSTIPSSEFKCYRLQNTSDDKIILEFTNPADKLEWTFYDVNKGVTHNGVSVSYSECVKYIISLKNNKSNSYLDCNLVDKIEKVSKNEVALLQSSCPECSHFLLRLINNQLKELIRVKLNEQITDNLYWHLSQILSSQQYNIPIPLLSEDQ